MEGIHSKTFAQIIDRITEWLVVVAASYNPSRIQTPGGLCLHNPAEVLRPQAAIGPLPFCRRRRSSVPDQVRQLKSRRPPIEDPPPTVTMLSRQALLRSARAAAPSRAIASQARFYAAAAATEPVKPPVALFGLDGTYATALVRHRAQSIASRMDLRMDWEMGTMQLMRWDREPARQRALKLMRHFAQTNSTPRPLSRPLLTRPPPP